MPAAKSTSPQLQLPSPVRQLWDLWALQIILFKFNKSGQMHWEEGPEVVYIPQTHGSYPHARGARSLVSVSTIRLHIHTGKHNVAQKL